MFDDLIRKLKSVEDGLQSFEIPIETDEDGYIDKECPNQDCLFPFKVDAKDWISKFIDEKVYCPNCKNESPANNYYPTEFIEQVKSELIEHVRARLFKDKPFPNELLPSIATDKWRLKIECENCKSKYSVTGSAFFCPCCGHNSIDKNFDDSIKKIKLKIESLQIIKLGIVEKIGIDDTEILIRSIKESCLVDSIVSFQNYSSLIFEKITGKKPKFNVFQRIQDGSDEWKSHIGKGYDDWLESSEKEFMNKMFQKRHAFSHKDGIVDQKYIDKSNDKCYGVGQRLVVNDSEIQELIQIILKVSTKIQEHNG